MDFPPLDTACEVDGTGIDAASYPTADIFTSATQHTKGSWSQVIASTAYDSDCLVYTPKARDVSNHQIMVDLAVGAAASEQVIIPNVVISGRTNKVGSFAGVTLPMFIPKGTRIAARGQSSDTSASSFMVCLNLLKSGLSLFRGFSRCTNYGAATATTAGVQIDPGGTADTKGSWTQITASTTNPMRYLMANVSSRNAVMSEYFFLYDIGVGSAGNEEIIAENVGFHTNADEMIHATNFCAPVDVPAGSRLAVRAQCDGTDATDRLFDIIILGFD